MLAGGIPQRYGNYYQHYFTSPEGRTVKQRAQKKYRSKLAQLYNTSESKAIKIHQQRLRQNADLR